MKRIFSGIALLGVFGMMLVPFAFANAQATGCQVRHQFTIGSGANVVTCNAVQCTFGTFNSATGATTQDNPPFCSQCCALDLVYTVTDWIFLIVLGLSIIFILIGAFNFITAGGSPEKAATGRQYLIYAVIGIIVAILAKAIPAIAKSIIGLT